MRPMDSDSKAMLDVLGMAEIFRCNREKVQADRHSRQPVGQMTDIQLLDEREVSRRLSVSVNTLRYWRVSGDGPNSVKLGRLVREI
jgi:hypothetical protein